MHAAVYYRREDLKLEAVPTPHLLTGVRNPVILGHELCGEVVALGAGVEDMARGELVAVEPFETCGHCVYCSAGQYNHCPLLALHGYSRTGGGLAEYTVVKRAIHRGDRGDMT